MLGTAADGWRPGWDFAGILRSDVDNGPRAGARVVGIRRGETWAEYVAVPAAWIAELPDGISFAEAAALPTAGLAALRMLRMGPAILGRRVLVTGPPVGSADLPSSWLTSVVPRSRRRSAAGRRGRRASPAWCG
jgi:NADPH:quinone reductase-like Zn-dependent oxidoreductase